MFSSDADRNSTPASVTQKELLQEALTLEEKVVQWTVKICCLLCSWSCPPSAAMLFPGSCLEHSSRWVTSLCQERQRYDRSESEEEEEGTPGLLMA